MIRILILFAVILVGHILTKEDEYNHVPSVYFEKEKIAPWNDTLVIEL